ncbi:MAG: Dam family site-specific DNA-(adenine-N6)-methyltransferase [Legionellales bacterium]|nr:Dam family site-specific DNA-(adenine-N6)-methyltransferase [Legionellales bacterium]
MKPFLKWAGNKYTLLERIKAVLPSGNRLVEPFTGAGSVFLNTHYPTYLLGENNRELLNLYHQLMHGQEQFIHYARRFFTPDTNQAEAYYKLRDRFNNTRSLKLKAALFLYLNRHTYNGLCRFNSSGHFNAPFGKFNRIYFPEAEMLNFIAKASQAEFVEADFLTTLTQVQLGDVVYCDPPYVPWSPTADFTCYSGQPFSETDQQALATKAEQLANQGIPVIISNHDTTYTRQLYQAAQVISFPVKRLINCNGENRHKPVQELLAIYQPSS